MTGPKGTLTKTFPERLSIAQQDDGTITVSRPDDSNSMRALHGLSRTLLANMVQGVQGGFTKSLEINGVGYRVAKVGENLVFQVGYSHPVQVNPPQGIAFAVEGNEPGAASPASINNWWGRSPPTFGSSASRNRIRARASAMPARRSA